jgi:hypothetical protein
MRRLILALSSLVLAAGMMTLATPGDTRGAQWCSKIEGHLHCHYYTEAQCRASVSGRMGYCVRRH